jgi:hypothetical protein
MRSDLATTRVTLERMIQSQVDTVKKQLGDKIEHITLSNSKDKLESNKISQQLKTLHDIVATHISSNQLEGERVKTKITEILTGIASSEKSIIDTAEKQTREMITREKLNNRDEIEQLIANAISKGLLQINDRIDQLDKLLGQQGRSSQGALPKEMTPELKQLLLEDVMSEVKPLLKQSLDAYYFGDVLNKIDYALKSMGAAILASSANFEWKKNSWLNFPTGWHEYMFNKDSTIKPPETLLSPDNSVGNCWAFAGSQGYAAIIVPLPIIPESFSIDHISRAIAPDFSSAPRVFSVYGYMYEEDSNPDLIGTFEYEANGDIVQNFEVERFLTPISEEKDKPETRMALKNASGRTNGYRVFNVKFESNHGNKDYTCVYRFRIHGKRAQQ